MPARGTMRLSSDLRGLASKLPEPFAKTADAARPLTISATFGGERGPRIQAQYGRDVHALLQWRSKPDDPPIERGIVSFGAGAPAALPQAAGLWLDRPARVREHHGFGRPEMGPSRAAARLSDWLGGARPVDPAFRGARLRLRRRERAAAARQPRLGDRRESAAAQLATWSCPTRFPGEVPMVLDLDRLHFGEPVRSGEGGPDPDPRQLPAIRVDIARFCVRRAASSGTCRRNSRAARPA